MVKPKILITGGAGFIGSRLATSLAREGFRISIFDSLSEQIHGPDARFSADHEAADAIECIRGDVLDRDALREALIGCEIVIHAAAETGTGQSMYEIKRYTDVNIGGTANLLDILAKEPNSVGKIVLTSSRAIYGEGQARCGEHGTVFPAPRSSADMERGDFSIKCPHCSDEVQPDRTPENCVPSPNSIYAITKLSQEQLVSNVCKAMDIDAYILRYQNVYGPGQSLVNPYTGIISIFSNLILNGKSINVFEDGRESRDFVFIDDVVLATCSAVTAQHRGEHIINVGSGEASTVRKVANLLVKHLGSDVPIVISGNFRAGDIAHNIADISRAKALLGFSPSVNADSGLKNFSEWVLSQNVPPNDFELSLQMLKTRGLLK